MSYRDVPADDPTRSLWDALRRVEDPEWPISVVDLGLVQGIRRMGGTVEVDMTFTSVGCPFVEDISDAVRQRLLEQVNVDDVRLEVTWAPWAPEDVTEQGRDQFATWGVSL